MNAPVEREVMEVDVLFVGAGPATLASAYHLMQTCAARGIEAPTVLVIEKGAEVGDHMLSGAVVNPRAVRELMPDFAEQGFPTVYVFIPGLVAVLKGELEDELGCEVVVGPEEAAGIPNFLKTEWRAQAGG